MDESIRTDYDPEAGIVHDADELRLLIERLTHHEKHGIRLPSDSNQITVRDVAEALHLPEAQVYDALEDLHREAWEARMSEALREAEEPLYRVERPSTANGDPLSTSPMHRLRSVQLLAERTRPRLRQEPKAAAEKESPTAKLLANLILVTVLLLVVALLGKAAVVAILAR